jgi:hypothetical protein
MSTTVTDKNETSGEIDNRKSGNSIENGAEIRFTPTKKTENISNERRSAEAEQLKHTTELSKDISVSPAMITTKSESEAVAKSMVQLAQDKGWTEIKVNGSDSFRKSAWLEAKKIGLDVKGFIPSESDKEQLASLEKGIADFRGRETEPTRAQRAAETFRSKTPENGIKEFNELASAYAVQVAFEKRIDADIAAGMKITPEQKARLLHNTREAIAETVGSGRSIDAKVKEMDSNRVRHHQNEREQSR